VRGTRGARHLASKTRVNALMTQRARRLRGALRPMTQQYGSRNNVTISMPDGGSVPIVSQTEIDPMKMALPSCSRLSHDDGGHRAAARAEAARARAGAARHGYIASGSFCTPSSGAQETIAKPPAHARGGVLASGNYCLRSGR